MGSQDSATNIQTVFLNQIRKKLPATASFADDLAELLNVSRDSAYRRIRGETVLSLDEVKKLYDQYGLSIDGIISPDSNMVLIDHQAVDFNFSINEWLKSIIQNLSQAKASSTLDLIYAAKDIPVFHYFRFPELTAFKLFIWSKTIVKDPNYEHLPYSHDVLPKEVIIEAKKAGQLYSSLASTEIWSDEAINSTLKQIEFYYECDYFKNRTMAIDLFYQLDDFIRTIKEEAAEGKKSEGGSFTLYQNDILIPDNTILVKMTDAQVVFINYNTTYLLTTYQDSFCEKTELYLKTLIKNSALISATAERERNRFFNGLAEKISISRQKLIDLK